MPLQMSLRPRATINVGSNTADTPISVAVGPNATEILLAPIFLIAGALLWALLLFVFIMIRVRIGSNKETTRVREEAKKRCQLRGGAAPPGLFARAEASSSRRASRIMLRQSMNSSPRLGSAALMAPHSPIGGSTSPIRGAWGSSDRPLLQHAARKSSQSSLMDPLVPKPGQVGASALAGRRFSRPSPLGKVASSSPFGADDSRDSYDYDDSKHEDQHRDSLPPRTQVQDSSAHLPLLAFSDSANAAKGFEGAKAKGESSWSEKGQAPPLRSSVSAMPPSRYHMAKPSSGDGKNAAGTAEDNSNRAQRVVSITQAALAAQREKEQQYLHSVPPEYATQIAAAMGERAEQAKLDAARRRELALQNRRRTLSIGAADPLARESSRGQGFPNVSAAAPPLSPSSNARFEYNDAALGLSTHDPALKHRSANAAGVGAGGPQQRGTVKRVSSVGKGANLERTRSGRIILTSVGADGVVRTIEPRDAARGAGTTPSMAAAAAAAGMMSAATDSNAVGARFRGEEASLITPTSPRATGRLLAAATAASSGPPANAIGTQQIHGAHGTGVALQDSFVNEGSPFETSPNLSSVGSHAPQPRQAQWTQQRLSNGSSGGSPAASGLRRTSAQYTSLEGGSSPVRQQGLRRPNSYHQGEPLAEAPHAIGSAHRTPSQPPMNWSDPFAAQPPSPNMAVGSGWQQFPQQQRGTPQLAIDTGLATARPDGNGAGYGRRYQVGGPPIHVHLPPPAHGLAHAPGGMEAQAPHLVSSSASQYYQSGAAPAQSGYPQYNEPIRSPQRGPPMRLYDMV